MSFLQIVDRQRQPLAEVTWAPPDKVTLKVLDSENKAALTAFIEDAQRDGVPFRTGREVKRNDKTVFVEEKIIVKPDDKRFLRALADTVCRFSIGGQRVFGVIKPSHEGNNND